jgi:threonine aldolase
MRHIDLRSDTVTRPTQEMRDAMYAAAVGDDVYGEDETVMALEQRAASLLGKEAGLYVTSGTQGNLVALLSHCHRGDEVILEAESHIFMYEVGGLSALGGLIPRLVKGHKGVLAADEVEAAIRGENIHYPKTGLICIENTHNRAGGTVSTVEDTRAVSDVAHRHGIPLHLDGARLFNAAVYLNVDIRELTAPCDSVSLCLSKGLSAPVGSVVVGSKEFIEKARKFRKMLGGGMRQVGVIAAAGLVALDSMTHRLSEDHQNAGVLAKGLAGMGLGVDLDSVQTNIVIADVSPLGITASEFVARMLKAGIKTNAFGPTLVRFVTHLDVKREDIQEALQRINELL